LRPSQFKVEFEGELLSFEELKEKNMLESFIGAINTNESESQKDI
jgi:hypothetical protein